jgi:hypothetical protein
VARSASKPLRRYGNVIKSERKPAKVEAGDGLARALKDRRKMLPSAETRWLEWLEKDDISKHPQVCGRSYPEMF